MIHHGDLFDVLPTLDADSIDACVTDPPYGIGFMGKEWDSFRRARNTNDAGRDSVMGRLSRSAPASGAESDSLAFEAWTEAWAREVYRVMKPGAYIAVFAATRNYHRMACGLEDAGFVIRDKFSWLFSSGFPKSLNFGCKCGGNTAPYSHAGLSTPERDVRRVQLTDVPTAVNAGDEPREVLFDGVPEQGASKRGAARPESESGRGEQPGVEGRELHRAGEGLPTDPDAGASESAGERLRAGASRDRGADSGSAIKAERGSAPQGSGPGEQRPGKSASLRLPSRTLDGGASERGARCERCGGLTSARGLGTALKPAHEPIALAWKPFKGTITDTYIKHGTAALNIEACRVGDGVESWPKTRARPAEGQPNAIYTHRLAGQMETQTVSAGDSPSGRWPANVLLDEDAAAALDEQTGESVSRIGKPRSAAAGDGWGMTQTGAEYDDVGGASRFYYVAKPSREERDFGCDGLDARARDESRKAGNPGGDNPRNRGLQPRGNFHPTVKPVKLMRWLVRLVAPVDGLVLDPFTGSGTTGMACRYEHRRFVGIEREADYIQIAERRIAAVAPLFAEEASA